MRIAFLSLPLFLFVFINPLQSCYATDTLTQSQPISVGQTLISSGQIFKLGFFSPDNSTNQYVGIWYNKPVRRFVWVANRENPILATDTASSLTIGKDGNLRVLDGNGNTVWSTNVSVLSNNSIAVLSDKGDLTIKENASGLAFWESFDFPCDTFLPGMMIGLNVKTGEKRFLTSGKNGNDPSAGEFVVGLTSDTPPQAFIWIVNGSKPYYRAGPWDGGKFIGIPNCDQGYAGGFNLLPDNQQGSTYH